MVKVLLYCYYPFFESHLGGGVQVWLRRMVEEINKSNKVTVDVICPDSNLHPLYNSDCVHAVIEDMEVNGIKPFVYKQYLDNIRELERKTDVVWIVDREFPIKTKKPFVMSLNTICYERELKAFFNNPWDTLFVLSDYEKCQIQGIYDDNKKIRKVPIFIDPIFKKKELKEAEDIVSLYFDYYKEIKYILFPHRPEREKGVLEALEIIQEVINTDSSYRLLIPRQPDSRVADLKKESDFLYEIENLIKERNLEEFVIFHDWIEYYNLPYYYSIGEVTLFLSTLPETFGMTLINSVACGTPVISHGSGALSEVVPRGNGHIIFEHDIKQISNYILGKDYGGIDSGTDFVYRKYDMKDIIQEYITEFINLSNRKGK